MTTKTESLVKRARLTPKDLGLGSRSLHIGTGLLRELRDAQLAKALWAVVDLAEYAIKYTPAFGDPHFVSASGAEGVRAFKRRLVSELEATGMKRPENNDAES